jgi:hypothetical protein
MTASELGFLGMGVLLGLAAGIALIETFRARPPARREVRVTVSADAIPRRQPSTLSDDAFTLAHPEPARGGPADRRASDAGTSPTGVDRRTPVRSGPSDGGPGAGSDRRTPLPGAMLAATTARPASRPERLPLRPSAALVPIPISGGEDPMLVALRAATATTAIRAIRVSGPSTVALLERPEPAFASGAIGDGAGGASSAATVASAPAEAGSCAELRRVAAERCELATRARAQAGTAEDTLRAAQRAYDDHESRAEDAARLADPRAVRDAKDQAQTAFRDDRSSARSTEEIDAAARAWLLEINRINGAAREAGAAVTREREAARRLALELERLAVEADAARIAAETADAACLAARQTAADCDERVAAEASAAEPRVPSGAPNLPFVDEPAPSGTLGSGGTPRIFRLLRGDRAAMTEIVTAMAGDDPAERKRWQLALAELVDAIVADSIAASALGFPEEHPFWGPFSLSQDRDIASALSSLGYRFDGLGGWVDGRSPSQRDLSLAVGYAGLDPMRIRHWPNETEMTAMFADVTVAADEHLATAAGDLTLGELVSMLGRRADGLAEVWNEWGRLRPLLLEEH